MKKNYYILVSEPWNFEGPDGGNIINGSIAKIVNDRCLIFHLNHWTEISGDSVDILMLNPRFRKDVFSGIERKAEIEVNGSLIKDYKEEMSESDLIKSSKFKIIGSLGEVV